jgi:hypothetical protein
MSAATIGVLAVFAIEYDPLPHSLGILNWQNTFRFQVQTVTTPKTMKKKNVARAIENARKTK